MSEDYATGKQNFYLQYFFPPSSVGETGRTGGMPGRREVGHGMLAQRALAPIVPDEVCAVPFWVLLMATAQKTELLQLNAIKRMAVQNHMCTASQHKGAATAPTIRPEIY